MRLTRAAGTLIALVVAVVLVVVYISARDDGSPREIVDRIHDRVSCSHPRPDGDC